MLRSNFVKIPNVNFETKSWFLSKFFIPCQVHERLFLCTFLAQRIYTLHKKSSLKWKILRLWSVWVKILSNSLCQFWYNNSSPVQILYAPSVSWKIIPLYFCTSNNIYFAQKKHIKIKIFETLKCWSEILSNSLRQFWKKKLLPLQIWYPSSVSWKIITLCFFSSINIYFAQKEHIKIKLFETFQCAGQISSNSLCQSWNMNSIRVVIFYPSSVSWKIIPLYFFSSNNIYFSQKEQIKVKIFETFVCSG